MNFGERLLDIEEKISDAIVETVAWSIELFPLICTVGVAIAIIVIVLFKLGVL